MPFSRSAAAWLALSGVLVLAAALTFAFADPAGLDWQPARAGSQPWRAWTAAWVHFSRLHLGADIAGAVLVGLLGVVAGVPARCAVAWLVAWPLTQLGLLARPELLHYGGLSGVLHAGVAIVAASLVVDGRGGRRLVGVATLAVLAAKVLAEAPWGPVLRHPDGWDIATAPVAHACGLVAGLLSSGLVAAWRRARAARPSAGGVASPWHRPG